MQEESTRKLKFAQEENEVHKLHQSDWLHLLLVGLIAGAQATLATLKTIEERLKKEEVCLSISSTDLSSTYLQHL